MFLARQLLEPQQMSAVPGLELGRRQLDELDH
jgi:hypothetical protein